VPALCETAQSTTAETAEEIGMADIGDHGVWATENNRKLFISNLTYDFDKLQGNTSATFNKDYIPIEAKVGISFVNALARVAEILDNSLVRFTIIFIALAYGFWLFFEAYTIISGKNKTEEKIKDMVKQGIKVGIWIAILAFNPIDIFMMVIEPILYVGTYISDTILNAITQFVSPDKPLYPDTCGAIHEYAKAHIEYDPNNPANGVQFPPSFAANLMCLPTRISGFCYAGIKIGRDWISHGFGNSVFAVFCGLGFVIGFLYLAWKFAFIAFGVIADLFLAIIMLPFTAIAETTAKTTYKGIAGDIFNGFLKLFSAESLQAQLARFVGAAWHFITMSVIISICIALLSDIVDFDGTTMLPKFEDNNVWKVMLISALTWWLAKKSSDLANEFGGKISYEIGTGIKDDIKGLWGDTKKGAKTVVKIFRNRK
jgi:hypothetical protein